jgi:hypothetical protein
MPNPRIFPVSDEVSAEQTEKDLSALQHSIDLIETIINGAVPTEGPLADPEERRNAIKRNAAHIRIMLEKPHIKSSNTNLEFLAQTAAAAEIFSSL